LAPPLPLDFFAGGAFFRELPVLTIAVIRLYNEATSLFAFFASYGSAKCKDPKDLARRIR
jgi:hypothetical protein